MRDAHGHVVVVVPGTLAHGRYPSAWWGSLGGSPGRDHVSYAAHSLLPAHVLPPAGHGPGAA